MNPTDTACVMCLDPVQTSHIQGKIRNTTLHYFNVYNYELEWSLSLSQVGGMSSSASPFSEKEMTVVAGKASIESTIPVWFWRDWEKPVNMADISRTRTHAASPVLIWGQRPVWTAVGVGKIGTKTEKFSPYIYIIDLKISKDFKIFGK